MSGAALACRGFFTRQNLLRTPTPCAPSKPVASRRQGSVWQKAGRGCVQVQSLFGWGQKPVVEEGAVVYDGRVTVAKVQVGLLGSAVQVRRKLERVADRADTDTPEGLRYVLQETVIALLRNPELCVYGSATGVSMGSAERAETRFNQYSVEERGKFEKETLVNFGGRALRSMLASKKPGIAAEGSEQIIVVTILLAAEGAFRLPKITSRAELRTALTLLGSITADNLLAVEVLWTPQEDGDIYTLQDMAIDYPSLNTL